MKKKLKSRITSVGIFAVVIALAASICATSLMAAADSVNAVKKFASPYDSFEEVLRDGEALNEEIAGEGFVLLKNENSALPLSAAERNVTLLGAESYNTVTGGGGSGTTNRPGGGRYSWVSSRADSLVSSLNENGFKINPRVSGRYGSGAGANGDRNTYMNALSSGGGVVNFGGTAYDVASSNFLSGADDNFKRYGDAAIISISRAGSEGGDNPSHNVAGHADTSEHYLTLNDSERQILAYAKYHKEVLRDINKIIIIVNSPAVMELGDVEDDDAFDAMLWVGVTGWNGAAVIGKILTGEINPSGRTVDFWARDFSTDPSWYGFGDYSQALYQINGEYRVAEGGYGMNYGPTYDFGRPGVGAKAPSMDMDRSISSELDNTANLTTYTEGIFTGYRYYETVAADMGGEAGEAWYKENTLYPFGYGLSYTSFTQEIVGVVGDLTKADGQVTVKVNVKNIGNAAGKEVVQLYSTPTYAAGEIDKAEVNLVGFAKTDLLRSGRSQVVDVTIDVKDLASFDYNDANRNNNNGYELEAGDYVLSVRKNSHEVLDSRTLSAAGLLTWDEDGNPSTPNNVYSQTDGPWEMFNTNASHWTTSGIDHDLHRNGLLNADKSAPSDLTELAWVFTADNAFTEKAFNVLTFREANSITSDYDDFTTPGVVETDYQNVWVKTAADMEGLTQGAGVVGANGMYATVLGDMMGLAYDAPEWDAFLNQLTYDELKTLIANGSYRTTALATIGKRQVSDADGPAQFSQGWSWVCEPIIAATWNVDLAYRQGEIAGNESMWQPNAANGGMGWYGPAMNTHRSPLSGRNFEYYSQDGMHGGLIAAAVVKGAVDTGARVYIKHSFLNDQETSRVGVCSLVNEQALRMIYAKPFELAIKKGKANGIMLSFNTIGLVSSASYATAVQLYANEWGYKGVNVTDYWMAGSDAAATGWDGFTMPRGLTIPLGNLGGNSNLSFQLASTWDNTNNVALVGSSDTQSYTHWYWVRETAKRVLYTHVNSTAGANGYVPNMFGDGDPIAANRTATVTGETYAALSKSLALTEELDTVFGDYGYSFSVTNGNLPAGLSLNAQTGVISGTPTQSAAGSTATITLRGNGGLAWISGTCTVTFNISDGTPPPPTPPRPVTFGITVNESGSTANDTAVLDSSATLSTQYGGVDTTFVGLVSSGEGQNHWLTGAADATTYNGGNGYIGAVAYTANGLPEGLSVNAATGAITGTPTEVGSFSITVTASVNQVTRSGWGSYTYGTRVREYSATIHLEIGGGYLITVVDGDNVLFTYTVADGQTATVQDVLDSARYAAVGALAPGAGMSGNGLKATADGTVLGTTVSFNEATTLHVNWQYPDVTLIDGIWWIHGVNTGIAAAGTPGEAGTPGADGADGSNGAAGENGISIVSVEKVGTEGLIDTYRITLSNGETIEYNVTNGAQGANGADGANGTNGVNGVNGANGSDANAGAAIGIAVAALVVGAAAAGLGIWLFIRKRKQSVK